MHLALETLTEDIERDTHQPLLQLSAASEMAKTLDRVGDELVSHFVGACRSAGHTWAEIGAHLNVTRQAAQKRFEELNAPRGSASFNQSSRATTPEDVGSAFFVYENWTNTFAKVHRAECSFCNHGAGVHQSERRTQSGEWHGPYASAGEALGSAKELAARHNNRSVWTVDICRFCDPT